MCPRPRPHRGRASFAIGQNFREVGLHQCPSERKGEGGPVRSLYVPSHVPSHPQTAARVRGFSPIAPGFTAETDWLLEESGFELSVPPEIGIVWCFASSASRGAADEAVVKGRLLGQPGPDMPELTVPTIGILAVAGERDAAAPGRPVPPEMAKARRLHRRQ